MRCKTCDYQLWNLRTRQCPECATAFKPSEFEFVPGSVRFCCPHCQTAYYGTDAKGHLVPVIFNCGKCGARIHMDEMVVGPSEGVSEIQTTQDRMPWLQRRQGQLIRSYVATVKWAMIDPGRLIRAVPADQSVGGAWLFAVMTTTVVMAICAVLPQLFWLMGPGGMGPSMSMAMLGGVGGLFLSAVGIGVYLLIWASVTHLVLRISGPVADRFRRTCHSIFYSSPANVLTAIPCCGFLVGAPWWIVSATNMVKESQKVHGARAAIAVLMWPFLSIFVWMGIYMVFIAVMMTTAMGRGFGGPAVAGAPPNQAQTYGLVTGLWQYTWQNSGAGPDHALELLMNNASPAVAPGTTPRTMFLQPGTKTALTDIPLAGGTLRDFFTMSKSQKHGALQTALSAQPTGVIAHRFGDFVFTYHGATLTSMDANLWTVVMIPDPAVNGVPQPGDPIYIGTGAMSTLQITYGQLPSMVIQQNQYRATLGLPPLPDLITVTHGRPAAPATAPASSAPIRPEAAAQDQSDPEQ